MAISKNVAAALAEGVFNPGNSRIDFKTIFGWSKITRHSSLSGEEVSALATKFGSEAIASIGLVANDSAAENIAADLKATGEASRAADLAKAKATVVHRHWAGQE